MYIFGCFIWFKEEQCFNYEGYFLECFGKAVSVCHNLNLQALILLYECLSVAALCFIGCTDYGNPNTSNVTFTERIIPMKTKWFNLVVLAIMSWAMLLPAQQLFAKESSYETIYRIFQVDHYPYREGCALCLDHFEIALDDLEEGTKEWAYVIYKKASCWAEEGRDAEALLMLDDALTIDPGNKLFLYAMGSAYFRLGNLESSEKYLLLSRDAEIRYDTDYKNEGGIYYRLACVHFMQAMKTPSDNELARENLINASEIEIKETISRYNDDFDTKSETIPDKIIERPNLVFLSLLSNIWAQQDDRVVDSVELLRRMVDYAEEETAWQTPERKALTVQEIKMNLGQLLYNIGNKEEGLRYMNEAVESAPSASVKSINKKLREGTINEAGGIEGLREKHPTLEEGAFIYLQ